MEENKIVEKTRKKIEQNLMEYKSFPIKAKDLEKYNSLYPKAAKIILQDFERISLETIEHRKKSLEAKISMDKLAQWQGFAVSIVMILSAVACGFCGQEIVASTLVGVSAIGLVKAILPLKKADKNNNNDGSTT